MSVRIVTFTAVWLGFSLFVHGQQPWDCSGRIFRVLEHDGGTELQELFVQSMTGTLSLHRLHFYQGIRINGIAYHPTQNMIYGVVLGSPNRLCRIDAGGNLAILRDLPLPQDYLFVSGDMAPDEKHLILFGYSDKELPNLLVQIDLSKPDYPTRWIPMLTTDPLHPYVYCADIAYHPTTGQLFGFDHLQNKLITLDPDQGIINNSVYPVSNTAEGSLPSLFFTPHGELFGIGSSGDRYAEDRYFYNINTRTGQLVPWVNLGYEANQDACSCPFSVHLLNRIAQRQIAPCTDFTMTLVVINRTDEVLKEVRIVDSFAEDILIRSVSPLPFPGKIEQGVGGHKLEIVAATIPIGRDSITLILHAAKNAVSGQRTNQARIEPLEVINALWLDSDDPETLEYGDPTQFEITPWAGLFKQDLYRICAGDTVRIESSVPNARKYRWSNGDTTASINVTHPGTYHLTVTSDCGETQGTATVIADNLEIHLGADQVIDRGTSIMLEPEIISGSAVTSYYWESSQPGSIDCSRCQQTEVSPTADTEYRVSARNRYGCTATDHVMIRVRELSYYVPNTFSPNGDQSNDVFYLQGPADYPIVTFTIYDRWGNALYEIRDGRCNDAAFGWDGTCNSKPVSPGVYSWQAKILAKDGKEVWGFGDVTLIR